MRSASTRGTPTAACPQPADYKTLQDFLFAYVAREAGRLGLAIHIHVANGGGANYDQRGSDPLAADVGVQRARPCARRTSSSSTAATRTIARRRPDQQAERLRRFLGVVVFRRTCAGRRRVCGLAVAMAGESALRHRRDSQHRRDQDGRRRAGSRRRPRAKRWRSPSTGMVQDGEITRARALEHRRAWCCATTRNDSTDF